MGRESFVVLTDLWLGKDTGGTKRKQSEHPGKPFRSTIVIKKQRNKQKPGKSLQAVRTRAASKRRVSDTQYCLGSPEGELCQYLNGSHFKVPGSSSWQYLHTT